MTALKTPLASDTNYANVKLELGQHNGQTVTGGFDGEDVSSHAGILLPLKLTRDTGLLEKFATIFPDFRKSNQTVHSAEQLVAQFLVGDFTGFHDFADQDHLKHDPAMLLAINQPSRVKFGEPEPVPAGKDTMHRFVTRPATEEGSIETLREFLKEFNLLLVEVFASCLDVMPDDLYVDFDGTDVPLHGSQEGIHYNKYYNGNCYMLQLVYCENFPLGFRLIEAKHGSAHDATALYAEVTENLRRHVGPDRNIILRGDGAYPQDSTMSYVEKCQRNGESTDFVFRLPSNQTLFSHLAEAVVEAEGVKSLDDLYHACQASGEEAVYFADFTYQTAKSWTRPRMVSGRLTITPNPEQLFPDMEAKYVVSSFSDDAMTPERVFNERYNPRGEDENWIKELKIDVDGEHASMKLLKANTYRLSFKLFAQSLTEMMRQKLLKGTRFETTTFGTIREKFINFGARVYNSHRRFHFSFAKSFAYVMEFVTAFRRIPRAVESLALVMEPPS